ncbi:reactive intermediate/imine deaminase [Pedobacter yonginense]|uniref:Reactive intermediate/imine deaminase n=1 Tax=Pedobacter yonginense TaxID=651869 RepID=A0A317ELH8_9SPHI|nr:RidA family protein [Pedobacter yonginense]PWS27235.1 reactive intermediate/imine deaminase [Pedobacter yonginense]
MKEIINTSSAPAPIGPYSQAVKAGNFLFVSGQVAINPENGELNIANIEEETHQVMRNLKAVLLQAELTFDHVVKSTIFLSDMGTFAQVNEVYGQYFTADFPARETVQVSVLPKNVNVEISVIAIIG